MVDLGGYVIILVETKDKKIKLYGSPADKDNLEVGDEILEVNGKTLEDATHTEVISHIHQCIRSRTICLRIKRRSGARLALDLDLCSSNVQDAFVIAVEQQARERLERLSALRRVTPIDMNKLSQQLNQQTSSGIIAGGGSIGGSGASGASISSVAEDLNGFISSNSPIYVTSLTASTASTNNNPTGSKPLLVGSTTVVSAAAAAPGAASYQLSAAQAVAAAKLLPNGGHHQSQQQLLERNRVPGVGADLTQQSGAVAGATKVPNDIRVPDIQRGKSIDSTGQVLDVRKLGDRRASSPFQNGRTELLIGADDCKLPKSPLASNSTLATPTETNNNLNKLAVDPELRPRRRSGSSIVVLDGDHHQLGQLAADPVKRGAPLDIVDPVTGTALSDADYNAMVLMLAGDAGPHREMAVDVPDSFVARNKTPPRYPPPKPIIQVGYDRLLGVTFGEDARERAIDVPENFVERKKTPPKYPSQISTKSGLNGTASAVGGQMVGGKPVPPPRDHLKMEVDGRVLNRAPAPQLPARSPISAMSNNNNNTAAIVTDTAEPTREQLDSIRKYQEQLRKRKEDEERITAQNEYLNRSLRGSRKLQALESRAQPSPPTGAVNEAFAGEDEVVSAMATTSSRCATPTSSEEEKEVVHTPYGYGELIAAVQRLHLHLKKAGNGHSMGGLGGLEGRVAAVQSVLLSPQFNRALAVHNVVQLVRNRTVGRPTVSSGGALAALRDVVDVVGEAQSGHAVELAALLTGYELEALMAAHDGVATALPEDTGSPISTPTEPIAPSVVDNHVAIPTHHHGYPEENNIKIIKIEKSTEPLGATVRNDGDAVVIGRVVRGGAADKSGLLHEGDELLEVNGIEMRGKSVNAVCDILAAMEGTLTFLVVPAGGGRGTGTSGRDTLLHVRAHFDYDPEEDMYIPCRELGISFQKGDVLHVISQEDSNWWQAYREGEEDQTLAGLVPSQAFQHQREAMRLAAEERLQRPPRKTATLLCGSGKTRKKRSKGVSSGGLESMYASSNDDHEPPDEILTYEEVSLYYPRANNKRPIVLIGPPNIGRHELRQRLMEDGARFAAAVPHTSRARKENERDGHDYHFITRAQFEADILGRRFVEHGEYERAYYGTSINAIRSVVQSGKICVLNLHPQSLRILRTSDLKPYVVFVAPPSLEKLRQKRIRAAEAYKEDELKDTIERAREMEDRYGHLFDMIIINNDTERAYHQLLGEINCLEREPQWVPAAWVKAV